MSSESKWPLYIQRRFAQEKAKYKDPTNIKYDAPDLAAEVDVKEVVGWIYGVLTTLDTKASALMRLNGVLIAAAAFLLGLFQRQGGSILSTTGFDAVLIIACALLSAISITLCLLVVDVSWPFLGKVTQDTDGKFDFSDEIKCLNETSNFRQLAYQRAWRISMVSSFGFLFSFAWQAGHVIYLSCFG